MGLLPVMGFRGAGGDLVRIFSRPTVGTPVVALDRGGPPVLTSYWPLVPSRLVTPSTPGRTARAIASALDQVIGQRGEFDATPAEHFVEGLLSAYDRAAEEPGR